MRWKIVLAGALVLVLSGCTGGSDSTTTAGRPDWCRYDDIVQSELDFQEKLKKEHGSRTDNWPKEALTRFADSLDSQSKAAKRLWAEAPERYKWSDVAKACGRKHRV